MCSYADVSDDHDKEILPKPFNYRWNLGEAWLVAPLYNYPSNLHRAINHCVWPTGGLPGSFAWSFSNEHHFLQICIKECWAIYTRLQFGAPIYFFLFFFPSLLQAKMICLLVFLIAWQYLWEKLLLWLYISFVWKVSYFMTGNWF